MRVYKTLMIEAAHKLPEYEGACQRMHGHSYKVEVWVDGAIGTDGMLVDFAKIGALVRLFDHQLLNDMPQFKKGVEPTAENMARIIAAHIFSLPCGGEKHGACVRVWETVGSYAQAVIGGMTEGPCYA